jgi:hypothetical protein
MSELCPVTALPCECPIFCNMQMQTLALLLEMLGDYDVTGTTTERSAPDSD